MRPEFLCAEIVTLGSALNATTIVQLNLVHVGRYRAMDYNELKALCSENDLDFSGTKNQLVARLVAAASPHSASSASYGSSSQNYGARGQDGTQLRQEARANYRKLKTHQLQKLLRDSWQDDNGTFDQLVERLVEYDAVIKEWPPESDSYKPSLATPSSTGSYSFGARLKSKFGFNI